MADVIVGGGGGGSGQIFRKFLCGVLLAHLLIGHIEIGVVHITTIVGLVVPSDVGIVPLAVQLYQVPGVTLSLGVAGDVEAGDAYCLQQQLIAAGVAGAHRLALQQGADHRLIVGGVLIGDGVGHSIMEKEALFIVALICQVGGQLGHARLKGGHLCIHVRRHANTKRGDGVFCAAQADATVHPVKFGVVAGDRFPYDGGFLCADAMGAVSDIYRGRTVFAAVHQLVIGIAECLAVVHLLQYPSTKA